MFKNKFSPSLLARGKTGIPEYGLIIPRGVEKVNNKEYDKKNKECK